MSIRSIRPDGWFRLKTKLPKPGTYKLLADFDPTGGTPQLAAKMFSTAGYVQPLEKTIAHPPADLTPKHGPNLEVELTTEPAQPIAGKKTMLFFKVKPAEGLEQYIGAWAHMLAVSNDLIDTIHSHPFIADGGPQSAVQHLLSARGDVQDLGAVPAEGRGEYGGVHAAGGAVEVAAAAWARKKRAYSWSLCRMWYFHHPVRKFVILMPDIPALQLGLQQSHLLQVGRMLRRVRGTFRVTANRGASTLHGANETVRIDSPIPVAAGTSCIAFTVVRASPEGVEKLDDLPMLRIHLGNVYAVFLIPLEWLHGRESSYGSYRPRCAFDEALAAVAVRYRKGVLKFTQTNFTKRTNDSLGIF